MADERTFPRVVIKEERFAVLNGGLSQKLYRQISHIIKRNNLAEDEVEILCHRYENEVSIRLNFPQPVSDNSEDIQHEVGQPAARKSEMPLTMTFYRTKTIPKYDQSSQKKSKYSASLQVRKFHEKCAQSSQGHINRDWKPAIIPI